MIILNFILLPVMISEDDNPSDINENEEYTRSLGVWYKLMSFNQKQIRVYLQIQVNNLKIVSVEGKGPVKETKDESCSGFINIKSMTDCLTNTKILSEFYKWMEINSSKIQEW